MAGNVLHEQRGGVSCVEKVMDYHEVAPLEGGDC